MCAVERVVEWRVKKPVLGTGVFMRSVLAMLDGNERFVYTGGLIWV